MDLQLQAGIGKWTSNSIMLCVSSVQIQLDHFRVAETPIYPLNILLNIRKNMLNLSSNMWPNNPLVDPRQAIYVIK